MKRFNNRVRNLSLTLIGLLIIALSIAYAYMAPLIGESAKTKVDIISSTLDKLTFEQGDPIGLTINLETLGEGQGNESGSTTSSVKLVANNNSNEATKYYDVTFDIEHNEFFYTTQNNTPEIILTIKDQNNNNVTSISGVTYVNQGGVLGFDITEYEGEITVKSKREITTTSSTTGITHTWTAIITFIHLDSDQSDIEGKTMSANLIIKEPAPTFAETILVNNGGKEYIETKSHPFNEMADTNEGMYAMEDDYGTSYYFRGAVDNNWVKFANYYWRIVRINGDGSVKLIYTGATSPIEEQKAVMEGWGTGAETSAFNSSFDSAEYIGYMYTLNEHRGHSTSSTIKTKLDTWYTNNLSDYEEYLSDFVVCNDRGFTIDNWTPIGLPEIAKFSDAYRRFSSYRVPQLICPHKEDRYTVNDVTIGNGKLTSPIGLLTADEAVLAGGDTLSDNDSYYLYTNQMYWLISPYFISKDYPLNFFVQSTGIVTNDIVFGTRGVRPVIAILPSASVTGMGLWNDPYIVVP